jgi:putative ABC transport system permease protein
LGATVGSVVALLIAAMVNHSGLTWVPPGNANAIPLLLAVARNPALIVGAWIGLVLVATLAALIPANNAGRLAVVDALRHV